MFWGLYKPWLVLVRIHRTSVSAAKCREEEAILSLLC